LVGRAFAVGRSAERVPVDRRAERARRDRKFVL